MTSNYSPSHASGVTVEGTLTQDKLFDRDTVVRKVTIKAGAAHIRGEALGKIDKGAVTSAAKSGGNTGTGTFVLDATTPLLANATPGVYQVRCITAATNGGRFELKNPAGLSLGVYDLPGTSGGSVTIADRIKGVLTDATDFAVGDGFDITVASSGGDVGKYLLALGAAVDGSAEIDTILLHDVDATASDQEALVAISGRFGVQGVTFGAGTTWAAQDARLRDKGIYFENIAG